MRLTFSIGIVSHQLNISLSKRDNNRLANLLLYYREQSDSTEESMSYCGIVRFLIKREAEDVLDHVILKPTAATMAKHGGRQIKQLSVTLSSEERRVLNILVELNNLKLNQRRPPTRMTTSQYVRQLIKEEAAEVLTQTRSSS